MQPIPFWREVATRGMEQFSDSARRFAAAGRRRGWSIRVLHAFVSSAAAGGNGGGVRVRWRILRGSGTGEFVWGAVSSGEIGCGGAEDSGELLQVVSQKVLTAKGAKKSRKG